MKTSSSEIEILDRVITVSLRNLRQAGCAFKVVDSSGNVFEHNSERIFKKEKKKHYAHKYEYGAVRRTYIDYIRSLEVGGVASIPFDDVVDPQAMQSGACAWMSENWGAGSFTTHVNRNNKTVEVLRLE